MNLPPLPLIDGCLFVDNSHWMEPLSTCDRLLEYQSLRNRISVGEKSALNFGTIQHLAREYRYKVYKNQPLDQRYHETIANLFSSFFAQHPAVEDDFRTLNWAIEVSKRYDEHYAVEPFSLLQYDQPQECSQCKGVVKDQINCPFCLGGETDMMVELPFALELYRHDWDRPAWWPREASTQYPNMDYLPVIYTGRIDLPILVNDHVWVMDHKTTSILGDIFWNKMKMSAQQKGYAWAFQTLTGKKVQGYIVNAIRTKEPPQWVMNGGASRTGSRQSPEQWWNESFQRERYYLRPEELNEWRDNAIDLVEEFFWHYSRGYMPMKTAWCSQFGKCQYYDVCSLAQSDRGILLSSGLFKDNDWTPLREPSKPSEIK